MEVLIDVDFLKKIEWETNEFTGWTGGRCPCCGGLVRRMGRVIHYDARLF